MQLDVNGTDLISIQYMALALACAVGWNSSVVTPKVEG